MTRDALARWIANPQLRQAWQPDAAESAVRFDDLDALVAYLEALK